MSSPAAVTIKEIAAALGMPGRTAGDRASKGKGDWPYREEITPTGAKRRLYPIATLPEPIREALLAHAVTAPPPPPKPATEMERRLALAEQGKLPSQFADWQRRIRDARLVILNEIDQLAVRHDFKRGRAVDAILKAAREGTLPPETAALVPVANARSGAEDGKGDRTLGRSSLYRWFRLRDELGPDALAPKAPPERKGWPWWWGDFRALHGRPSKPSIAWCLEELTKAHPGRSDLPSYDQIRRQLAKLSIQDANRRSRPRPSSSICRTTPCRSAWRPTVRARSR